MATGGKSYWPPLNHQKYATAGHSSVATTRGNMGRPVRENETPNRSPSPTIRRATNMEAPLTGGKRKTLGGRGREWAHHCHKLLEDMRELDESEPFRNPVDSLKFKDYYSIVGDHMDLSQVMIKLHGGKYDSPEEFSADIYLIFDNWKMYLETPQPQKRNFQLLEAVQKIRWWFDLEFNKIVENWGVTNKVAAMTKRYKLSDGNVSMLSSSTSPAPMRTAVSAPSNPQVDTNILVSIQNGNLSIFHQNQNKASVTGNISGAKKSALVEPSSDQLLPDSPLSPPPSASGASSSSALPPSVSSGGSNVASSRVELKMESTSIWFGPCRSRPVRSVVLTEEGFTVPLHGQDGKEHTFRIDSSEIVRCCGHLGKNKKHTLFIFITPPCENRLKEMSQAENVFSTKPDREPCSIIAMFIKSLDPAKCGKLAGIFWMMSRVNIFGHLFSEVDTTGALKILGYIKPQIVDRVQDRFSETDSKKKSRKASTSREATTPRYGSLLPLPESPPPPPDRVLEPPASPEPSERGNPPRLPRILSADTRDSPLSPPPRSSLSPRPTVDHQAISDDDDLTIIEDPSVIPKSTVPSLPPPVAVTIDDDADECMIAEQHFSVKCPITQQTMICPVKNRHCKHNYDRIGVEQLITNRGVKARCPVPGCDNELPLHMLDMELDYELKAFIDSRK